MANHFTKNYKERPELFALAMLMADKKVYSGLELKKEMDLYNSTYGVSTMISELRHNGFEFAPTKYAGKTGNGKKIYLYQMTGGFHNLL